MRSREAAEVLHYFVAAPKTDFSKSVAR